MNGGEIQQIGTPTEVYRRPATTFVATFIGSPRDEPPAGARSPGAASSRSPAPGDCRSTADTSRVQEGDEVDVGVRPERLDDCSPRAKAA